MRSLGNEQDRSALLRRLRYLRPDAQPRWGQLDATRMLAHVGDSVAVALGDLPGGEMGPRVFRHFPLKHLVIYVVPFPKDARSPKEFLVTQPEDFEAERQRLIGLMERAAAAQIEPGTGHPLLGPLTVRQWWALGWKHLDHHLRQFGC
jgi:hypothetical protein